MSVYIDPQSVKSLFLAQQEKASSKSAFFHGQSRKLVVGISKTDPTLASKVAALDASLTDQLKAGEDIQKVQDNAKAAFSAFTSSEQELIKQVAKEIQQKEISKADMKSHQTTATLDSEPDLPADNGRFMSSSDLLGTSKSLNLRA